MKCKLNIKAPNGNNSVLFKDIVDDVLDLSSAVDMYYYTKTQEFKDAYKGDKDSNGEPIYSQFSDSPYLGTVDYHNLALDKSAEVYKELIATVPKVINLLNDRISTLQGLGRKEDLKYLQDIVDTLESESITSSIPKFLKMAQASTAGLRKKAQAEAAGNNTDIAKMAAYNKIADTYSVIDELRQALSLVEDSQQIFTEDTFSTRVSLDNIRAIEQLYINESIEYLTNEFHKRDNTWSKRDIREALRTAPRDMNYIQHMVEYLGDASDRVISMVGEVMLEKEHTIRRLKIDFNKQLATQLEKLEAEYGVEDVFKDLIVDGPDGSVHVVDPDAKFTDGRDILQDRMYAQTQKIKNNGQLMEFLTFYNSTMNSLQAALPAHAYIGTRLPAVLRSELELLQGKTIKEKGELLQDKALKTFQASNLDLERGKILDSRGKPMKSIPTFYTQKYDSADYDSKFSELKKKYTKEGLSEEAADSRAHKEAEVYAKEKMSKIISRDLASSLQAFHAMATNYAVKNEAIHIFESAEAIVASKYRDYIETDSKGKPIIHNGRIKTKSGDKSNAGAMLQTFLEMQLYGEKQKSLGFTELGSYTVDWNKVLRGMNSSTGYIMQAVNVLGAISNFAVGTYNNWMETTAGEYYKTGNIRKATAVYNKELFNTVADIGERVPKSFINLMEEHYNLLQNYNPTNVKTSERNRAARLFKTDSLYFLQNMTEHGLQIKGSFALMDATKMFDKNGNDKGSVLDNHKVVDGKLQIPADLYVKSKEGKLVKYDTAQQNRLSNKATALMRKLHGNYSQQTANKMQQDARTAMMMKFRGWMAEGIVRRFSPRRENRQLEQETEGFYRTGGRVLRQMALDLSKLKIQVMKENWRNLTPHEKANLHRLVSEAGMITITGVAAALLGSAGKLMDEFDTNDPMDRLVLGSFEMFNYQVNRLYTELFAYVNPKEALKLLATPMATATVLESLVSFTEQALSGPFEVYEQGWRKGDSKLMVKAGKLVPLYKQLSTLNPDGIQERARWFY